MNQLKEPLTDEEAKYLCDLKAQIVNGNDKRIRLLRRQIRNKIFRIRRNEKGHDVALKKVLEAQFQPDMKWKTFTHNWDVAPYDPLEVVSPYEWSEKGGKFDQVMVQGKDGILRPQKICEPTAFTKQE